jgi:hypothetical protein
VATSMRNANTSLCSPPKKKTADTNGRRKSEDSTHQRLSSQKYGVRGLSAEEAGVVGSVYCARRDGVSTEYIAEINGAGEQN